jgi:2,3,4,5-tetrahydropyridine-2-carboxylate N-succinyltransferase
MSTVSLADLELEIEAAWEARDGISAATQGPVRTAVEETLALLDSGKVRVPRRSTATGLCASGLRRRCCCPSA